MHPGLTKGNNTSGVMLQPLERNEYRMNISVGKKLGNIFVLFKNITKNFRNITTNVQLQD